MKVFVSVGRTSTEKQEKFVQAIEATLKAQGLEPVTAGRSSFSSRQPLLAIHELMKECVGTAIIAFERTHVEEGMDRRGGEHERKLADVNVPTVWNQIEAAMAYVHDHPLLVIVEDGLKTEGLLETGYDWYVQWVRLDPAELAGAEFQGVLADWKRRVSDRASIQSGQVARPPEPAEKLTIGAILASLTVPQIWAAATAVLTVLASVAAIAYKIGTLAPK